MRIFYEEWKSLEPNSSVVTDELQPSNNVASEIHQLQLTNYVDFPGKQERLEGRRGKE